MAMTSVRADSSSATASSSVTPRASMTSRQPRSANARASARPNPRDAPVIRAVLMPRVCPCFLSKTRYFLLNFVGSGGGYGSHSRLSTARTQGWRGCHTPLLHLRLMNARATSLAAGQEGLLTHPQLSCCGYSKDEICHLVDAGYL